MGIVCVFLVVNCGLVGGGVSALSSEATTATIFAEHPPADCACEGDERQTRKEGEGQRRSTGGETTHTHTLKTRERERATREKERERERQMSKGTCIHRLHYIT